MPRHGLAETLEELVHRHGMNSVLQCLAEMQASPTPKSSSSPSRKRLYGSGARQSAIEYVCKMSLSQAKSDVMMRVARRFEDKEFLPGMADVREFCRICHIDANKISSRASAIPRVFTFLATMDVARIEKMLSSGAFSGPARLGPIADAIRNYPTARDGHQGEMSVREKSHTAIADRSGKRR